MTQLQLPPKPMAMDAQRIYQSDPLGTLKTLASFGDVISFQLAGQNMVLVNRSELIQEVLVNQAKCFGHAKGLHRMRFDLGEGLLTSAGEDYQAHRRMSQRAFQSRKIRDYEKQVHGIVQETIVSLPTQETINLSRLMMEMTLTILGQTLFNFSMETHNATIIDAMSQLVDMNFDAESTIEPPEIEQAQQSLDASIYALLQSRGEHQFPGSDLFDELNDLFGDRPDAQHRMRDSVLTMILAGHETTASVLAWTWLCLQQTPQAFQALQNECRSKSMSDIIHGDSLSFTQAVLTEAMRLHPPVWLTGRRALHDTVVEGFQIPSGTTVVMSQYLMHRDERYFEDPNTFQPDRWLQGKDFPRFAYFPFGGGHRKCIGADLAWLEAAIILAHMMKSLDIHFLDEPVTEPWVGITMRPRKEIRVKLDRASAARELAPQNTVWDVTQQLKEVTPPSLWNDQGFQNARNLFTKLGPAFTQHPFAFEHDLTAPASGACASLTMGFPTESLWVHEDNPNALWPLLAEACGGVPGDVSTVMRAFDVSKRSVDTTPRRLFCAIEKTETDDFAVTGLVATFRQSPKVQDGFEFLARAYSELSPHNFIFSNEDFDCLTALCGTHHLEHIGVSCAAGVEAFKAYPMGNLSTLFHELPTGVREQFMGEHLNAVSELAESLSAHQTNLVLDVQGHQLQRLGIELKLRHQKKRRSSKEIEAIFNSTIVKESLHEDAIIELQKYIEPQRRNIPSDLAIALNHLKVSFRPGGDIQWKAYWVYL